jgi:hypothetical protein
VLGHVTARVGRYLVRFSCEDLWTFASRRWRVSLSSDGRPYLRAASGDRAYFHRVVCPGGDVTDHRNGDTLDNRRGNLRPATLEENARNHRVRRDSLTGVRGVSLRNGRYLARLTLGGRRTSLGSYPTLGEARAAVEAASVAHHGEWSPCLRGPRD